MDGSEAGYLHSQPHGPDSERCRGKDDPNDQRFLSTNCVTHLFSSLVIASALTTRLAVVQVRRARNEVPCPDSEDGHPSVDGRPPSGGHTGSAPVPSARSDGLGACPC